MCLSVFPLDILKIDAARIIKPDVEMFHDESWKPIYFGVKRSKVKITSHNNIAGVGLHSCECWLLPVQTVSTLIVLSLLWRGMICAQLRWNTFLPQFNSAAPLLTLLSSYVSRYYKFRQGMWHLFDAPAVLYATVFLRLIVIIILLYCILKFFCQSSSSTIFGKLHARTICSIRCNGSRDDRNMSVVQWYAYYA